MRYWCKLRSRSSTVAGVLAALILSQVALTQASPERNSIAVVASLNVPVDNLSMVDLRRLFLLERRFWKPGQAATVLYPAPGSAARSSMLRHISRGDETALRRLLLELMYRGDIDLAPKVAATDEEALAFVASGRGLVTLVSADRVDGASVKVLSVDGQRPGGPGYPLSQ